MQKVRLGDRDQSRETPWNSDPWWEKKAQSGGSGEAAGVDGQNVESSLAFKKGAHQSAMGQHSALSQILSRR